MSVTSVSDCSDSSINYNDVADCHIQIRASATQFESNDHSKVESLLYVHMHCHLPSSSRFADALLAGSMTGNVDSCTEQRDDRPRWMVHFLLRRLGKATIKQLRLCSAFPRSTGMRTRLPTSAFSGLLRKRELLVGRSVHSGLDFLA